MKILGALLLVALGAYAGAAGNPHEELAIAFDRAKGGIHAIYARALQSSPGLSGKIVFELDIGTSGAITACRVKSSTLRSPDVESKMCDRIRQIKLAPRSAPITLMKPIDFFPAR